ncbi:MAG: hypothetical protein FJ257_06470 [Phycisphaerae bacterium]|nr:hypothetical protein [Phycisphaerae bacterium]
MLAASEVAPRAFLVGCLGLLPGTAWMVAIGAAARRAAGLAGSAGDLDAEALVDAGLVDAGLVDAGLVEEIALLVGLLAIVLVAVVVTRIAMRALRDLEAP